MTTMIESKLKAGMRVSWRGVLGTVEEVREHSAVVRLDEPYDKGQDIYEIGLDALELVSKLEPQAEPPGPRQAMLDREAKVIGPILLNYDEPHLEAPDTIPYLPKTFQAGYIPKGPGGRKPTGEVRACLNCGKERYVSASNIKRRAALYCSDCRGIATREGRAWKGDPMARRIKGLQKQSLYYEEHKDEIIDVCKRTASLEQASKLIKIPFTKTGNIYRATLATWLKRWGVTAEDLGSARKGLPLTSSLADRRRRTQWYDEHKAELIEACVTHDNLGAAGRALAVPWDPGYLTRECLRLKMHRWGFGITDINRMRAERKEPVALQDGWTTEEITTAMFAQLDATPVSDLATVLSAYNGLWKRLVRHVQSE